MRLLFVVDGRSPISLNWIRYFVELGEEVHLVSTFDCQPDLELASFNFVPVAFSQLKTREVDQNHNQRRKKLFWSSSLVSFRTSTRRILAPFTIPKAAAQLAEIVTDIQPDLIHTMRIPFEGMLAAEALTSMPRQLLLVSVWGNDFTLHAGATPWMSKYTRRVLGRANGLHTDCYRDQRLAHQWGFDPNLPAVVMPGNGGIHLDLFYPPEDSTVERRFTVINPRGFRSYIRNDTFFNAIPLVVSKFPQVKFICPGMAAEVQAQRWVKDLGIASFVELLPGVSRLEMADLFRRSAVSVSPSKHDGTPNTLLEAMACGCFPIAGDIDSLHEWIDDGFNGLLFNSAEAESLAEAIIRGLQDQKLQLQAAVINSAKIEQSAEYHSAMKRAQEFYHSIIAS
jgi:glycosyltransferase involved in cell wall biosynthesis